MMGKQLNLEKATIMMLKAHRPVTNVVGTACDVSFAKF